MRLIYLRSDKKWIAQWSEVGPRRLVVEERVSDGKCSDKLVLNYFVTTKCRTAAFHSILYIAHYR
jgi:hypothetical protein